MGANPTNSTAPELEQRIATPDIIRCPTLKLLDVIAHSRSRALSFCAPWAAFSTTLDFMMAILVLGESQVVRGILLPITVEARTLDIRSPGRYETRTFVTVFWLSSSNWM
jgi:hypothetical protein